MADSPCRGCHWLRWRKVRLFDIESWYKLNPFYCQLRERDADVVNGCRYWREADNDDEP